ncbi:hypothetical protein AB5J72_10190 [Streptomyces sp. CG1]|uniref:hypothetical protein n=1 Tax=Streptomyces sp. CG1 TaxID=1287523 RepID=UPI0034E1FFBA
MNGTMNLGRLGTSVGEDKTDFAGLYVDEAHHTIDVYTASGNAVAKARTALAAQHHTSPAVAPGSDSRLTATTSYAVKYVPVKYSQRTLESAANAIAANRTIDGVRWTVAGTDPRTNKTLIGVPTVTADLRARVKAKYGDLVELQATGKVTTEMKVDHYASSRAAQAAAKASPHDVSPANRLLDFNPWYGGDRIVRIDGNNVIQCTAGIAYSDPYYAPTQMLYAGHCAPKGYGWKQGYYDGAFHYSSSLNGHFGVTGWQTFNGGYTDAALITGDQGAQYAWDIYVNGSTYWHQSGYAYNQAGNGFCSDGSFTQENCHGVVQSCGNRVQYSDGTVAYDMCIGQSNDGSRLSQHGDSGGPIISGSPMVARGIISGGNEGNTIFFTPWEAVNRLVGGHPCPC